MNQIELAKKYDYCYQQGKTAERLRILEINKQTN